MRSTTKDLLLWEQRINERTKSGMSVSEWCKNNEISKSKYHYWNHKLSKKHKPYNEMSFVEITPILSTADEAEHIYIVLGTTDFRKQQNGWLHWFH